MPRRESDSLIVLGGRESRPHGEAARQDRSAQGNILCTQRQGSDVNGTERNRAEGKGRWSGRLREILGSPVREIRTPGSEGGKRHKCYAGLVRAPARKDR